MKHAIRCLSPLDSQLSLTTLTGSIQTIQLGEIPADGVGAVWRLRNAVRDKFDAKVIREALTRFADEVIKCWAQIDGYFDVKVKDGKTEKSKMIFLKLIEPEDHRSCDESLQGVRELSKWFYVPAQWVLPHEKPGRGYVAAWQIGLKLKDERDRINKLGWKRLRKDWVWKVNMPLLWLEADEYRKFLLSQIPDDLQEKIDAAVEESKRLDEERRKREIERDARRAEEIRLRPIKQAEEKARQDAERAAAQAKREGELVRMPGWLNVTVTFKEYEKRGGNITSTMLTWTGVDVRVSKTRAYIINPDGTEKIKQLSGLTIVDNQGQPVSIQSSDSPSWVAPAGG
jgi:hypothetical protein